MYTTYPAGIANLTRFCNVSSDRVVNFLNKDEQGYEEDCVIPQGYWWLFDRLTLVAIAIAKAIT